jgi:hypothetical protein
MCRSQGLSSTLISHEDTKTKNEDSEWLQSQTRKARTPSPSVFSFLETKAKREKQQTLPESGQEHLNNTIAGFPSALSFFLRACKH